MERDTAEEDPKIIEEAGAADCSEAVTKDQMFHVLLGR